MRNKLQSEKGFTLIEVLGVLVILCVIFVVVFPNILNQFKKSEDAIDEATKKVLVDAAKDYMNQNYVTTTKTDSVYCLELNSMMEQGFLKENQIKDVKKYVKVSYQNNIYIYDLSDTCEETNNNDNNNMLLLLGNKNVRINLNGTYTEAGAYAIDKNHNDMSANIVKTIYNTKGEITDFISTNKITKYVIEYTINLDGNDMKTTRNVDVVDIEKPVIANESSVTDFTDEVSSFDLLSGITVYDNSGETITPTVTTNLSLGVPGIYKVVYTATDSSNNKATLERTLQIYVRKFSYSATKTTSTYGATKGESCKYCNISNVSSYGTCLVNGTSTVSADSNYHYGTCSNGQSVTNSVCGYGVSIGNYVYYDCVPTYSCPSGGSLSGSTCTKTTYSCPEGGTLNGTICEM